MAASPADTSIFAYHIILTMSDRHGALAASSNVGVYEVNMLDRCGLDGRDNECGGVYSVKPPWVSMCLPPLSWHSEDIEVTAPRFFKGRKGADAWMTVRPNGVMMHDDLELEAITRVGVRADEAAIGPLVFPDHGNPVCYRNIWAVPRSH